jgi:hypothetical protein
MLNLQEALSSAISLQGAVGHFASREHQRVAEILHDYDPSLSLVFVPADQRDGCDDFPYAVLCTQDGRAPYIVRRVRAEDMNEKLLSWIFYNDQTHGDPVASIDAAQEAIKLKRTMDLEDAKQAQYDFAKSVLRGKNWFRHDGRVYS